MTDFTKTVNPGRHEQGSLFVSIKYTEGRLAITGVVGPKKNGDATGPCGQVRGALAALVSFAPGWDAQKAEELASIWEAWHLNDMRSGCAHQRDGGWKDYDEHPGEACPICGYRFGSAWLFEPVPEAVLLWLFQLPESMKKAAWV